MEREKAWREFMALSDEDQRRVVSFIASLRVGSRSARSGEAVKQLNLAEEQFVGMWQGREDMRDSTAWLREVREREWTKPHG